MPAWRETTQILLQLNALCKDLGWLLKEPHYQEIKKLGHWGTLDATCGDWIGASEAMLSHLEADMLMESREAVRAAVVEAAENGLPLRWEMGGELEHAKVATAHVKGGTVTVFLPAPVRPKVAV